MSNRIRLISDFNAELFGRYLTNSDSSRQLDVVVAPFGQVYQSLAAETAATETAEMSVVWTRPEGVLETFRRAAEFEAVSADEVLREVDDFADHVLRHAKSRKHVFVASWTPPFGSRGYGVLDYRPNLGLSHLLARMNLHLADRLAVDSSIFILDSERWMRAAGQRAYSPKLWYASKVPFGNTVFEEAAKDVYAALDGLAGTARRLIVLDLDNTLWGGVVGEGGWQGLTLGGHDHVGEAFVDFQRALKGLINRGIQLAVVSKNDAHPALEAIDHHPDMLLRRRDIAAWRINWDDKARNVASLVEELNLGLQSVVFIDDSAIERGRVREALPEVLVPEWPSDPAQYRSALEGLKCFDVPALSSEDRTRGGMYAAERERRASGANIGSIDDWLRTLEIRVDAETLSPANITRATQLFNKTNQMNLATRRLSERELLEWASAPQRRMWTVRVADRFGESGLTGIISAEIDGSRATIVDFVLSCRVMGRKVEEAMLYLALSFARAAGVPEVTAEFRPTPRNRPCLEFWESTDFTRDDSNVFRRDAQFPYPAPDHIDLVVNGELVAERPETTPALQ